MSDPVPGRNPGNLLGFLIAFLLVVVFVPPPFNMFVGVFAPIPLTLIYLRNGRPAGLGTIFSVFVVLFWILGVGHAIAFLGQYGLMAMILAETIHARVRFDRSIFFSGLGMAVISAGLVFITVSTRDGNFLQGMEQQVQVWFADYLELLKKAGEDKDKLEQIQEAAEKAAPVVAMAFPSMVFCGTLMAALINYLGVRWLWNRFYSEDYFRSAVLVKWVLPDQCIWLFFVSVGGLWIGNGALKMLAVNLCVALLLLYFLQGLMVVLHFFVQRGVPRIFWGVMVVIAFNEPYLMSLLSIMGIIDIWADLRKIRQEVPEVSQDGGNGF